MSGEILPPREPIANDDLGITQPWYRYLVSRKRIQDGTTAAPVVTFGDASTVFPSSRRLVVTAGQLTETDGGEGGALTLGLANSGVTAATYGAATKLVVLAIDAKGRVTAASEVTLNSDNVTEGVTNLYFTQARARASVSGSAGITYNSGTGAFTLDQSFTRGLLSGAGQVSYNAGTGAINTTGKSGTGAYTNFTFVNGICTAAT